MKTKNRSELLSVIDQMCERYPNWRFGQLIANLAGWADQNIWDIEDEQLVAVANEHLHSAKSVAGAPAD